MKKPCSKTKTSLQALQTSETRYRRLFETAQDGILILNAETGRIDDVNPYMIDMLHYSHEEFIGKQLWEVSPFKNTVLNIAAFAELQEKGYIRYKDLPLETKEGKPVAVEFVSNVYKSNGNQVIQCNIRNITERKEVDRKLLEAVMFQQRLIDALPVPVFYIDSEGRYLGCNNSFEKFSGQTREQTNGKTVYELFPKKIADLYHEKNLVLLQNPGTQIYETTVKDEGGLVHHVIFHKATFPNLDGSAVGGLIGAILDITDRKRSEEALRESEELFRSYLEYAPDAVYMSDLKGTFLYGNRKCEEIIGYRREELLGKNLLEFNILPEKSLNKAAQLFKSSNEGKPTGPDEMDLISKEGRLIPVEINTSVVQRSGQAIVLAFVRDITERKQAEEERKQSFERMRKALLATVHSISIIVEMKDPYTSGHQRRVADLARSIAKEMGLSADRRDFIRTAATIHDIGKIAIPSEILSKPTKLTDLEFSLIKTHAQAGYDILKDIEFPWPVADVVLQHHERMNGSGYPQGLKGNDILLEARILAVADVVEAMASHRPYRPALGLEAAMEEIMKNKGILYDADVVDACSILFSEKSYQMP